MKKFVIICIIICSVFGFAFAATTSSLDSDSVKVRTKVGEVTVQDAIEEALKNGKHLYNLFVSLSSTDRATSTLKDVSSSVDPTEGDVIAYFRVFQEGRTKTEQSVKLSFAAGPLQLNGLGTSATQATGLPTISAIQANSAYSYLNITSSTIAQNEFEYNIQYQKVSNALVSVENTDIGTFTAKWDKVTTSLEEGDYVASISMILTSN